MAVTTKPMDRKEYPPSFSKREIQDSAQAKKENKLGMRGERYFRSRLPPIVYSLGESAGRGRQGLRKHLAGTRRRPRLNCGAGPGHGPGRLRGRSEVMRNNAGSLAKRSANFRPFNSSSPTWPPRSKLPDCWCITPRGLADRKARASRRNRAWQSCTASEVGVRVASEAVQIFRRLRFIKDYPVEKFYRDFQTLHHRRGTSEIQRMIIAQADSGKALT